MHSEDEEDRELEAATAALPLPDAKPWDPEAAMAGLADERAIFDLTPETQAEQILRQGAVDAATSLVHIARHGEKEQVRVSAAKEILTRVFGNQPLSAAASDPLALLVGEVVKEAEAAYVASKSESSDAPDKGAAPGGPLDDFRPDREGRK